MTELRKDFSIWLKIHGSKFFFWPWLECTKEMTKPVLSTWGENGFSYSVALHQVTDSSDPKSFNQEALDAQSLFFIIWRISSKSAEDNGRAIYFVLKLKNIFVLMMGQGLN